jgi:DNA-binding protein Fis
MLECMMLNPEGNWEQAAELLGEYQADIEKWMRKHGDEHVSPLGKD